MTTTNHSPRSNGRTKLVRTLREQVVAQVRNEVLSGQLPAGERLREVELAERFGVSRGPVRDALLQLTQEGLLIMQPHCGAKVAGAPSDAVRGLIVELRKTIERHALEIAFEHAAEADLRAWEDILERLRRACAAGDMAAIVEHDMAFHRWIVEQAHEPDLLAVWLPIVVRMRLVYSRHRELPEIYHEHAPIVAAFRRGNRKATVRALEANIC